MKNNLGKTIVCVLIGLYCLALIGCSNSSNSAANTGDQSSSSSLEAATSTEAPYEEEGSSSMPGSEESLEPLADGDYTIEADTDSSMFRIETCTLHVANGEYHATIALPGEGFSRLFFGSAEEALTASDTEIYDYYVGADSKYTFDIPVATLEEEIPVAAFGHRRDTWYDHTIVFHAPAQDSQNPANAA